MSLYSGITFSTAKAGGSSESPILVPSAAGAGVDELVLADGSNNSTLTSKDAALEDAERYAAAQVEQAAKDAAERDRKAALGFMPIVRKRPAPGAARKATTTTGAMAALTALTSSTVTGAGSRAVAVAGITESDVSKAGPSGSASNATISAPPAMDVMLETASSSTAAAPNLLTGRTLIVPPSMTLDEDDVNGFKASAAGKRATNKGNKNNKRKGKNKREEDPALAWTAEYDPARPTDYNEYKIYSKLARAERREAQRREREKERQKRLKEAYGESGSGSNEEDDEYYSGSEEDSDTERRRRIADAEKKFAGFKGPTKVYDIPPEEMMEMFDPEAVKTAVAAKKEEEEEVSDVDKEEEEEELDQEPVKVTEAAVDEWAAWSGNSTAVTTGATSGMAIDDPYARRMAMSQQRQQPSSTMPVQNQAPPIPTFSPQPAFHPASASPQQPQQQPSPYTMPKLPIPGLQNFPIPGIESSIPLPPPSFLPSTGSPLPFPPQYPSPIAQYGASQPIPPTAPAPTGPSGPGVTLEEAQAKARAIAARLAALGKFGGSGAASTSTFSPSPSPGASMYPIPGIDEPIPGLGMPSTSTKSASTPTAITGGNSASTGNPEEFAANLMAKYGWSKGQGLGATSQGMLNPLALSSDKQSKGGGKKKQAQQAVVENKPIQKVTGMATAKGRVVSDLKSEKDRVEKEKYGEPSRVVCLSNMVGREEVDDELVRDVSEEARKHGVLEQCFIHLMPSYVPQDEAVRVFIIFSGLVGAWKAVKAFDGRFFGGRTVRAKFYDEKAFATRTLHL